MKKATEQRGAVKSFRRRDAAARERGRVRQEEEAKHDCGAGFFQGNPSKTSRYSFRE